MIYRKTETKTNSRTSESLFIFSLSESPNLYYFSWAGFVTSLFLITSRKPLVSWCWLSFLLLKDSTKFLLSKKMCEGIGAENAASGMRKRQTITWKQKAMWSE
jgi:hypothetical protein